MNPVKLTLLLFCILLVQIASAYTPFVDNKDFFLRHLKTKSYLLDSTANAIVLYEQGTYVMDKMPDGSVKYNTVTRRIIKILTTKGIAQADIAIPYQGSAQFESRPEKIIAKTYSLENGEVKVMELDSKVISTEVANDYLKLLKFSLPAVTEGVIIDYSYEISQPPTISFADWNFQDKIPVLHSEVSVKYLEGFQIAVMSKTNTQFVTVEGKNLLAMVDSIAPTAYSLPSVSFSNSTTMRWARRNLQAINPEPYNYNIQNYTEGLNVYVIGFPYSDMQLGSWDGLNKLLHREYSAYTGNIYAKQRIKELTTPIFRNEKPSTTLDSIKTAFKFIRANFNVLTRHSIDVSYRKLETVIDEKKGNAAELNLLLSCWLSTMGIKNNMVVLGTREMPRLNTKCPVIDHINYIVCRVEVDDKVYFLDLSEKYAPFGTLPMNCYNGFAWALDEKGFAVNIAPENLKERVSIVVSTENSDIKDYTLNIVHTFGNISGPVYRKEWLNDTTKIQEYLKDIAQRFVIEADLADYVVENLQDIDVPLKLSYKLKLNFPQADKLFFQPSLFNFYIENPLKSSIRITPVELPYAVDYNYMIMLKLPQSYSVSEITSSLKCKLAERDNYTYDIEYKEESNTLNLATRLRMNNTFFDAVNYSSVQNFLDKVISQQIKPVVIVKNVK